jgi:hypothetical protein
MAALPPDRVHQGAWVDDTQGPILGATTTTTTARANLIIATLSLPVTFTGSHLWDLIAFAGYCMGLSPHQALARTITSTGAFTLEAVKVGWRWRRHRPWFGLGLMSFLALACSVGFLAAGIFVSLAVSNSGIQCWLSGPRGFLSWRNETTDQLADPNGWFSARPSPIPRHATTRPAIFLSATCLRRRTFRLSVLKMRSAHSLAQFDILASSHLPEGVLRHPHPRHPKRRSPILQAKRRPSLLGSQGPLSALRQQQKRPHVYRG